jgi:hypothetical protein
MMHTCIDTVSYSIQSSPTSPSFDAWPKREKEENKMKKIATHI